MLCWALNKNKYILPNSYFLGTWNLEQSHWLNLSLFPLSIAGLLATSKFCLFWSKWRCCVIFMYNIQKIETTLTCILNMLIIILRIKKWSKIVICHVKNGNFSRKTFQLPIWLCVSHIQALSDHFSYHSDWRCIPQSRFQNYTSIWGFSESNFKGIQKKSFVGYSTSKCIWDYLTLLNRAI